MKARICVPMGDAAGVGPEILVAAAPLVLEEATLVGIGHEEILRRAAQAMDLAPHFHRVARDASGLRPDALNLIHVDALNPDQVAYGQVSAACGRAAFDCIALAVELAMAGRVDALATTPINKESLHAAKVPYIGHTEILAKLTGSHDPLTMFQVRTLRVFFLTRHLSLAEACRAVRRERVLEYIRRCMEALRRLGLETPRLAVAALNPHGGEHGLFGEEEDREILPAIQKAQAEGHAVEGPKPADSVFHFAMAGAWDAVLSLYHDQGHIATKMVDFERTISLTLGLPFLRSSVDHGTAFDIAGTGKASAVSMVEAIRLAAAYAPNFRRKKEG